mmetsp:Transcript_20514/g.59510  ORF Transcript_20514/g.59510 Transcript_20514/m.59510 type:complete len:235 (-) Transcript_20514:417-1121(-)
MDGATPGRWVRCRCHVLERSRLERRRRPRNEVQAGSVGNGQHVRRRSQRNGPGERGLAPKSEGIHELHRAEEYIRFGLRCVLGHTDDVRQARAPREAGVGLGRRHVRGRLSVPSPGGGLGAVRSEQSFYSEVLQFSLGHLRVHECLVPDQYHTKCRFGCGGDGLYLHGRYRLYAQPRVARHDTIVSDRSILGRSSEGRSGGHGRAGVRVYRLESAGSRIIRKSPSDQDGASSFQ